MLLRRRSRRRSFGNSRVFEAPDTAAGGDVAIVDSLAESSLAAANVIDVIRISAVDEHVSFSSLPI